MELSLSIGSIIATNSDLIIESTRKLKFELLDLDIEKAEFKQIPFTGKHINAGEIVVEISLQLAPSVKMVCSFVDIIHSWLLRNATYKIFIEINGDKHEFSDITSVHAKEVFEEWLIGKVQKNIIP